jgi:3-keto-disaccharide hydrolase
LPARRQTLGHCKTKNETHRRDAEGTEKSREKRGRGDIEFLSIRPLCDLCASAVKNLTVPTLEGKEAKMKRILSFVTCISALIFGCAFLASAGTITADFNDDAQLDDWTVLSGSWSIQDDIMHQDQMGGPIVAVWNIPEELEDFTINVTARALTGDADWGLAFRAIDANNHYSWQYVNGHLAFVSYIGGARAENWTQNQPMEMDTWQEFEVTGEGNYYTLSWKGEEIHVFEHDALTGGKVGLFTWDQVEFDDFTVTADSLAGQAVSPVGSLTTAWGSIKVK